MKTEITHIHTPECGCETPAGRDAWASECQPCSCALDDEPHCSCSDVHYPPAGGEGPC